MVKTIICFIQLTCHHLLVTLYNYLLTRATLVVSGNLSIYGHTNYDFPFPDIQWLPIIILNWILNFPV